MRIFISGASGFLGSRLAAGWRARGHEVAGSCSGRRPGRGGGLAPLRLGDPVDPGLLAGVEAVVHAAHDFSRGGFEPNVAGTRALHEAGRGAGVRRQIFIGSCSAVPGAPEEYGRVKHALERFFLEAGGVVVRPGLVVGRGGRFGAALDAVRRFPVLPLVDGGRDAVPVVGLGDFVAATTALLEGGGRGAFNLFNDRFVPLRELLGELCRLAGRRRRFPPLPSRLLLPLLAALESAGVPLPAGAGSLRALKRTRQGMHGPGDLPRLIGRESSLAEMLQAALAEDATPRR